MQRKFAAGVESHFPLNVYTKSAVFQCTRALYDDRQFRAMRYDTVRCELPALVRVVLFTAHVTVQYQFLTTMDRYSIQLHFSPDSDRWHTIIGRKYLCNQGDLSEPITASLPWQPFNNSIKWLHHILHPIPFILDLFESCSYKLSRNVMVAIHDVSRFGSRGIYLRVYDSTYILSGF